MRKITLKIEATVVVLVDDGFSMDDLACGLGIQSEDESVDVLDSTIDDYAVEESK